MDDPGKRDYFERRPEEELYQLFEDFTRMVIRKYGLEHREIVIRITDRNSPVFIESIRRRKEQSIDREINITI